MTRKCAYALLILAAATQLRGAVYYSQHSDAVGNLANWNTARDSSGTAPGAIAATDTLVVQSGDSLWLTAADTAGVLDVEGGAKMNAAAFPWTLAALFVRANAEYVQGGAVQGMPTVNPTVTCSLDVASTYRFNGTQAGTGSGAYPEFGNLVWEPAASGNGTFSNQYTGAPFYSGLVVRGTMTINIQGATKREVRFATGGTYARTHTIGGSLIINSPSSSVVVNNGTITSTVTIGGDLVINAGIFKGNNSTGTAVVNLGGSIDNTGGDSLYAGPGVGAYAVNFTGTATALCNPGMVNSFQTVTVPSGKAVYLNSHDITILGGATFAVSGELNCYSDVTGAGNFTLSDGAALGITDTGGVDGSIAVGGTKTLSTAADYLFNGAAAQVTGAGLPAMVRDLRLYNANGLTLTGPVAVTRTLNLNNGVLATGGNLLAVTSDNLIARGSGYVNGGLAMHVAAGATVKSFPVGSANGYSPMVVGFNNVSMPGTLTVRAVQGAEPHLAFPDSALQRYWAVTQDTALAFDTYSAGFTYLASDFTPHFVEGTDELTMVGGKYDGGWTFPFVGNRDTAANSIALSGLTSFSNFTFGKGQDAFVTGVAGLLPVAAFTFSLCPMRPNPVRGPAEFHFTLPAASRARLEIFNVLGQRVRTVASGTLAAGPHTVRWNGDDEGGRRAASGVYVYQLTAGNNTATKRLTLVK